MCLINFALLPVLECGRNASAIMEAIKYIQKYYHIQKVLTKILGICIIVLMPVKSKKTKTSRKQTIRIAPVHFFAGTRLKLEVIIIGFLAVSALLMLHITAQREELVVYKQAVAGSTSNK